MLQWIMSLKEIGKSDTVKWQMDLQYHQFYELI